MMRRSRFTRLAALLHARERPATTAPSDTSDAKAPLYRSIRFRLTAWYAAVLLLTLVAVGWALSVLLERTLEADIQQRLEEAVYEIRGQVGLGERSGDAETADPAGSIIPKARDVESIVVSGIWVEIIDTRRNSTFSAGNLPEGGLPKFDVAPTNTDPSLRVLRFSVDETEMQAVALPIIVNFGGGDGELRPRTIGAIVVGQSREPMEHTLDLVNRTLRVAALAGLALAIGVGWLLAGRALAPVERITRTAREIGQRHDSAASLHTRLVVPPTGDELARLAATFNAMLARIEAAFAAQRRFVADASHELRTPLTAIRGNVEVLLRQTQANRPLPTAELTEALTEIRRESGRMGRLVEDLLLLARTDIAEVTQSVRREPLRLDLIAREAFRTAESLRAGQRLAMRVDQPIPLEGDRDRLTQVILIVLDNALRHTPSGGLVTLRADTAWNERASAAMARVVVRDTGEGIAPEHLPHLFERFYRVQGSRSPGGTGLGLAIAHALVEAHSGQIEVRSELGRGTAVTIWLPLPQHDAAPEPRATTVEPRPAPPLAPTPTSRPAR